MSHTRLALVAAVGLPAAALVAAAARPRVAHYRRWRRLDPAARAVISPVAPAPLAIPDPELADLEL
jgi:hypothetical protein